MSALEAARLDVAQRRAEAGEGLAAALVALAELEPSFKHRAAPVRTLLFEAAALLDRGGQGDEAALRGRVLLRLGGLKMDEEDFEGAEQLIDRAFDLLRPIAATDALIEAGALLCRVQLRRRRRAGIDDMLARLGALLDDEGAAAQRPGARRAAIGLAIALGEVALEGDEAGEARARVIFEDTVRDLRDDDAFVDARYLCHQALALLAMGHDPEAACHHLRRAIALAKASQATVDETELRLALAGALVERGDLAGRDEAERHLQVARDATLEAGLDSLHMAALVGQAGLMAQKGQTQGALDRCLEIARAAVAKHDLPRYGAAVALMAEIYRKNGDFPSAYRTLAEAEQALVEQLGEPAREVVRPHLVALADAMGRERFVALVEDVRKAAAAVEEFRREDS